MRFSIFRNLGAPGRLSRYGQVPGLRNELSLELLLLRTTHSELEHRAATRGVELFATDVMAQLADAGRTT